MQAQPNRQQGVHMNGSCTLHQAHAYKYLRRVMLPRTVSSDVLRLIMYNNLRPFAALCSTALQQASSMLHHQTASKVDRHVGMPKRADWDRTAERNAPHSSCGDILS
jgi:hypothetical protein